MSRPILVLICALATLAWPRSAYARTKLVALPGRDQTHIRLDHADYVLVQEERQLMLRRGQNQVDFSWLNVNIDPGSIQFQALTAPDQVGVLSVSYPPEGQSLVWQIDSTKVGAERIRISYLISGFNRSMAYRATADADERELILRAYLRLGNQSGEAFTDAHIAAGFGAEFDKTLKAGESKEMLSFAARGIPVRKTFTYDNARTGETVRLHYVIPNAEESGLGAFALRTGKARLFQEDGHGTTAFLGEDWVESTPVGEDLELYVGDSRDVVVKRHKMGERRLNERRNKKGNVVLYDREEQYKLEIENFRPSPVELTVIERLSNDWSITKQSHPFTIEDSETVEFTVAAPAKGTKTLLEYTVVTRNVQ